MSNRPWRVKPSEIFRTIKTVQQTGLHVRNIEIGPDGLIRVNVGEPEASPPTEETSEQLRKML